MAKDFELDMSAFIKAMEQLPEKVGQGAQNGLEKIKDDWVKEAQHVAPEDTGNLHDLITGEVRGQGANGFIEVAGNAHSMKGGDHFNYAYYIHEQNAGGKSLRTDKNPNAIKKFLDQPAEDNLDKWQGWMEDEFKKALGEWSE